METRLCREQVAEAGLDFFISKDFLKMVKPGSLGQLQSLMMVQQMLSDVLGCIKNAAPHAYVGRLNAGMDYSTGYFRGSREMKLFLYSKKIRITKEDVDSGKVQLPEKILEEINQNRCWESPWVPAGYGADFWANDCLGRVSEIRLLPSGQIKEQVHGRAGILLRDPVDALKSLLWDSRNHDFYHALNDEGLMHIIKETDEHDELLLTCKSHPEMVGKLTQKLAEAQFSTTS